MATMLSACKSIFIHERQKLVTLRKINGFQSQMLDLPAFTAQLIAEQALVTWYSMNVNHR